MIFDFPTHSFPWWPDSSPFMRPRPPILPSEWAEKHFRLSTAYATQGPITLFPWQVDVINSPIEYQTSVWIAPTQTGKSMLAEAYTGYLIDRRHGNIMFVYHKKETVADVFDERFKPMVKEVPAIRRYWDGDEDNLTKRRFKFRHLIMRIASAGTRGDIAAHNAPYTIGDEFAKWPRKEGFDQVKMLKGRTQASVMLGKETRALYQTSPIDDQDKSWAICHDPHIRFTRPYVKCPHCGTWICMQDKHIQEKPNRKGVKDHNPQRIRAARAAWYQCPVKGCGKEITEEQRYEIWQRPVWADEREKIDQDGKVHGKVQSETVVRQWNRLVVTSWTFAECLACFFEAYQSADSEALKTYVNEDMADWVRTKTKRVSENYLASRMGRYHMIGTPGATVPEGVAVVLCGIDTQDGGFYYVIRGFGFNVESWLLRCDFVQCDMSEDRYQSKPQNVLARLQEELGRYPLERQGGQKLGIAMGLIDRGGHRSTDVDYIVGRTAYLYPYIGTTYHQAPLIEMKKSGIYHGHTRNLSRQVAKEIEGPIWHIPQDCPPAYMEQVLNHYEEEYTDTRGHTKRRWVTGDDHGMPDHYRDCECMIAGVRQILSLERELNDESVVRVIGEAQTIKDAPEEEDKGGREKEQKRQYSDYLSEVTKGLEGW